MLWIFRPTCGKHMRRRFQPTLVEDVFLQVTFVSIYILYIFNLTSSSQELRQGKGHGRQAVVNCVPDRWGCSILNAFPQREVLLRVLYHSLVQLASRTVHSQGCLPTVISLAPAIGLNFRSKWGHGKHGRHFDTLDERDLPSTPCYTLRLDHQIQTVGTWLSYSVILTPSSPPTHHPSQAGHVMQYFMPPLQPQWLTILFQ